MPKYIISITAIILASLGLSSCSINSPQDKLNKIFQLDTLGQQVQYFETQYGVAKRVQDIQREYDINGCIVNIYEDKNHAVQSMELVNISKKCDVNLKGLIQDDKHLNKLTFNDFISYAIDLSVDESCYGMCGNSSDPQFGILLGLPHSLDFNRIHLTVGYVNENDEGKYHKAVDSSVELNKQLVKKFGDFYDLSELLNDKNNREFYNTEWIKSFGNNKISSFRFGNIN